MHRRSWFVRSVLTPLAVVVAIAALAGCSGTSGGTSGGTDSSAPRSSGPARPTGTSTSPTSSAPGGPSSSRTLPAPAPLRRVGITFGADLAARSRSGIDAALDDVVALHMTWIRVDVSWAAIQPVSADLYQWPALDSIVASARERRLHVLALLTYTPPWARESGCRSFVCPPRDPQRFADFAGTVARRYAGSPIAAYQVWNEPNLSTFWPDPDAGRYGRLLRATSSSVRDADSAASVVFGGLAYPGPENVDVGPAPFLRRACAGRSCTGGVVDAVGYDPYTFPRLPSDTAKPFNAWQLIANPDTGPGDIRAALTAVGLARTPVWVTGFGAPTGGGARVVAPQRQRDILLDGLRLARQASPLVGGFFVDTLSDSSQAATRGRFGIAGKPAYAALAAALG